MSAFCEERSPRESPCKYCEEHAPGCHNPDTCKKWKDWKEWQTKRAREIWEQKHNEAYYGRIGKKKNRGHARVAKQLKAAKKGDQNGKVTM